MSGRKLFVIVLAVLTVAFLAGTSMAGITGTSHELSDPGSGRSACAVCHIPHGSQGARLWPVPPVSGTQFVGTVSTLCGTCHFSGSGYAQTFSGANSDNYVFGANSHGVQMTLSEIPGTSTLASSGLPYTGDTSQTPPTNGVLECTSCHNVHDDTNRPFLRADISALCARCHGDRNFQAGSDSSGSSASFGNWGSSIRDTNPGSHPVGTDITGDVTNTGNSPITFPAEATVPMSATANQWSLGGHMPPGNQSNPAVSCVTCHAVHGIQPDPDDTNYSGPTATGPTVNMLIIGQSTGGNEGESRSVANGDGAYNPLCEACHTGTTPNGYTGSYNPNPGGTAYTHPVDDLAANYDAGVTAFPTNWPVGGITGGSNVDPVPICESCHSPHIAANRTRTTYQTGAGPFILRDDNNDLCNNCHSSSFAGHHPVGADVSAALGGAASYLTTGYSGMNTTKLTCGTCHAEDGNNGAAHNWAAAAGVGLNKNWRPVNNGRDFTTETNDQYVGTGTGTDYYTSTTCMDCHLEVTNSVNPSDGTAQYWNGSTLVTESEYQDMGDGSHYIGPFSSAFFGTYQLRNETGNVVINVSDATGTNGKWPAGGWSRFGGDINNPVLVCESCHELEPDKNSGVHMLLYPYIEGDAGQQDYASLCEGCHGVPAGTHPMTGDNVGRTGTTLQCGGSYNPDWLVGTVPNGNATWGTNEMSCDSCHQPHAAPTASGTLILDSDINNYAITGGGTVDVTLGGVSGNGGVVAKRVNQSTGTLPNFGAFCAQCHAYLQ